MYIRIVYYIFGMPTRVYIEETETFNVKIFYDFAHIDQKVNYANQPGHTSHAQYHKQ